MKKGKWVYLLHYEMAGLCKIEDELKKEISSWIKITTSPSLSVILQKVQLYAEEHSSQLGYFLENKQISTLNTHQSVIRMLSHEIKEKLKYCASQIEKEHCILSNIAAISCLKTKFYDSCLTMATRLNHQEAMSFFHTASANEKRICKWTSESKKPQKESNNNHYLLL
jgi:hypothetical protein